LSEQLRLADELRDRDELERAAADWLVELGKLTPAALLVERALADAYIRRQGGSETARRVMYGAGEPR